MRRSDQRRAAVVALYQHEVTGRPIDEVVPKDASTFARELVDGVLEHQEQLDALIERYAQGWTLDRIAPLERSILRTALYEMLYRQDVPDEVAIDEAVEAAKELCAAEAPKFVNGILGAVKRTEVTG
ncbi:MAG TPA: transcription antitermination factor NusB [Thermoleophilaceae bacterium]|nr:transcription antitermination factor NusB [Thermoleophilaceae bacterium]